MPTPRIKINNWSA